MISFLVDSGITAGFTIIAGFIGHIMGFSRGVAEKNHKDEFRGRCTCGHPWSYHSLRNLRCGEGGGYKLHCACQHYEPDGSTVARTLERASWTELETALKKRQQLRKQGYDDTTLSLDYF